ncbi:unnamed protein product [Gordionus sp. m RMFG-2023]|uniref:putative uncharacterized protein DDB_G0282133 n=1 Tax=Gordionus sp. m RMFG-2023 TaxID=3053472 RepID=UPI0030E33E05
MDILEEILNDTILHQNSQQLGTIIDFSTQTRNKSIITPISIPTEKIVRSKQRDGSSSSDGGYSSSATLYSPVKKMHPSNAEEYIEKNGRSRSASYKFDIDNGNYLAQKNGYNKLDRNENRINESGNYESDILTNGSTDLSFNAEFESGKEMVRDFTGSLEYLNNIDFEERNYAAVSTSITKSDLNNLLISSNLFNFDDIISKSNSARDHDSRRYDNSQNNVPEQKPEVFPLEIPVNQSHAVNQIITTLNQHDEDNENMKVLNHAFDLSQQEKIVKSENELLDHYSPQTLTTSIYDEAAISEKMISMTHKLQNDSLIINALTTDEISNNDYPQSNGPFSPRINQGKSIEASKNTYDDLKKLQDQPLRSSTPVYSSPYNMMISDLMHPDQFILASSSSFSKIIDFPKSITSSSSSNESSFSNLFSMPQSLRCDEMCTMMTNNIENNSERENGTNIKLIKSENPLLSEATLNCRVDSFDNIQHYLQNMQTQQSIINHALEVLNPNEGPNWNYSNIDPNINIKASPPVDNNGSRDNQNESNHVIPHNNFSHFIDSNDNPNHLNANLSVLQQYENMENSIAAGVNNVNNNAMHALNGPYWPHLGRQVMLRGHHPHNAVPIPLLNDLLMAGTNPLTQNIHNMRMNHPNFNIENVNNMCYNNTAPFPTMSSPISFANKMRQKFRRSPSPPILNSRSLSQVLNVSHRNSADICNNNENKIIRSLLRQDISSGYTYPSLLQTNDQSDASYVMNQFYSSYNLANASKVNNTRNKSPGKPLTENHHTDVHNANSLVHHHRSYNLNQSSDANNNDNLEQYLGKKSDYERKSSNFSSSNSSLCHGTNSPVLNKSFIAYGGSITARSRDQRRAEALKIPFSIDEIIYSPIDEFTDMLRKHNLTDPQISLIRDIRRRGKNKVAAQNCRKRKIDGIMNLEKGVGHLVNSKASMMHERVEVEKDIQHYKEKYNELYSQILSSLRDDNGQPYSENDYMLQFSMDGNLFLIPRNNVQTMTQNLTNHHNANTP